MAENVNIITWQNVDVIPADDALTYETAIGAGGVIYGCDVTLKNSNTMHIAAGHAIICGRKMTIVESDLAIPLSTSGLQLGRLYLQLDLSNTAAPARMLTEVAGALTPPIQDENVNIFNGTSEINLYTFTVSPSTIGNLVRVASPLANILGNFAPIETKLNAAREYLEGTCLIKDNQLYEAIADINPGDRLDVGENLKPTTMQEKINALYDVGNFHDYSLGNRFTTEQAEMIAAGDFKRLMNGGYWDVDGRKVRIVDNTNWYARRGDQGNGFTAPHLVIMCDENILKADGSSTRYMKDANDTTGAYASTKYRATYRAQCKRFFTDFFGAGHIASYRGLIATAVANGRASSWAWNDCDVELPTENMVFGSPYWGNGAGNSYNGGSFYGQLALFRLAPQFIIAQTALGEREHYWEQDVVSASTFAFVTSAGNATYINASNTTIGLRPFALLI